MTSRVFKIAAMACSYNRIEKTKAFLESLTAQYIPGEYSLDIYILDDKSPDGTANYIRQEYPAVDLIEGSGSLFWAGGMRMLWQYVKSKKDYDFYLLLNDDVKLFDNALGRLLDAYQKSTNKGNIILGSVKSPDLKTITYGGRRLLNGYNGDSQLLIPDDNQLLECQLGNANICLVDKITVDKIGILSDWYIHSFADFDYTLRAIRKGGKVWVAPGYYGSCDYDHGRPWMSADRSLKDRINYMRSPKGLESVSYLKYIKEFFPLNYPAAFFKLWLKTLFPSFYDRYKK
jgi:GT2 family glycosyltransferase